MVPVPLPFAPLAPFLPAQLVSKAVAAKVVATRRAQVHERYVKMWAKKVLVSPEVAAVPLKDVDGQLASKFEVSTACLRGAGLLLRGGRKEERVVQVASRGGRAGIGSLSVMAEPLDSLCCRRSRRVTLHTVLLVSIRTRPQLLAPQYAELLQAASSGSKTLAERMSHHPALDSFLLKREKVRVTALLVSNPWLKSVLAVTVCCCYRNPREPPIFDTTPFACLATPQSAATTYHALTLPPAHPPQEAIKGDFPTSEVEAAGAALAAELEADPAAALKKLLGPELDGNGGAPLSDVVAAVTAHKYSADR